MLKEYKQETLTPEQQIQLLKTRGLIIKDEEEAKRWLSYTSYFRFNNYALFFYEEDGQLRYKAETTFEKIVELYTFDQKLKVLLFDAIENIEISIKTQICNTLHRKYGAHWYLDRNRFLPDYKYEDFITLLDKKCTEPEEWFIKHYNSQAYRQKYPPSWMIMEVITFGAISQIFEGLSPCNEKNAICEHFKLPKNVLTSWLHCFTYIRNKCMHHSRIVYKKITIAPVMPLKKARVFLKENDKISNDTLYAVLCAMRFMLMICNSKSEFKENLLSLINQYPDIDYKRLGFTDNWRDEDIWT